MNYTKYINTLLKEQLADKKDIVLFGQNIDAGSCLSGLSRGLSQHSMGLTINTQNSESSLVGVGFGLMMNHVSSIFLMKQLDFLLLGIDQLVNTYNIIRQQKPRASFTIVAVTVDTGFDGPQSSFNACSAISSIAGIEAYSLTNAVDTKAIIGEHLLKPGFRIITTGQLLLQNETLDLPCLYHSDDAYFFQYSSGRDVTVVCFNQALHYGHRLCEYINNAEMSASLFSVNAHLRSDFDNILTDLQKTKKLIIIDDTKSIHSLSDKFLSAAYSATNLDKVISIKREPHVTDLSPGSDALIIDYDKVISDLMSKDKN